MNAQPVTTTPAGSFIFGRLTGGITHRDVICLSFAIAVHSLLFLFKGGHLLMPDTPQKALGDMLVEVRMMDEMPSFDEPGGSSPAPKTFFERMKSMVKGEGGAPKKEEIAMGEINKIEAPKQVFNKPDVFNDKAFKDKKAFDMAKKQDALDVAMGKTTQILDKPSQPTFKTSDPALKENAFKVAPKDAPFQIVKAKTNDSLTNVNAVPVVVGRTTSSNVKSLEGGPALQTKAFAADAGKSFGGGSLAKKDAGAGLATGSAMAPATAGTGAGAGFGSGSAANTGRGTGSGSGSGLATGNGSGRSWGGAGSPAGSNALQSLPRNMVKDEGPSSAGMASAKGNGFNITGALANRPIVSKVLPPYEQNARVALRFRVDWSGRVLDGIIIEMSSGSPSFDNKVLNALKEWQFSRLPANRTNEIQEGVVTFVFKGV